MGKRVLVLLVCFLLIGANVFAGNGDLIVNGNVGIGTTNPGAKLEIAGSGNQVGAYVTNNVPSGGNTGIGFFHGGQYAGSLFTAGTLGNGGFILKTGSSSTAPLRLQTGNADRIWITAAGNVGIGLTSPSYQLHLSTDSAAKPSTSTWQIVSDARLKTNIQSYTKGLKEILQINPVSYKYNGKGGVGKYKIYKTDFLTGEDVEIDFVDKELLSKTNVGVIAQDIQAVVPESVSSHKDKINENDEKETDILDFNAHSLIFILINAVKELSGQIDSLNKQIADLKAK